MSRDRNSRGGDWTHTDDPDYELEQDFTALVDVRTFNQNAPVANQFTIAGGGSPSVSMDQANSAALSPGRTSTATARRTRTGRPGGRVRPGVRLVDPGHHPTRRRRTRVQGADPIRNVFRVNSAAFSTYNAPANTNPPTFVIGTYTVPTLTAWACRPEGDAVASDLGDVEALYQGYGPGSVGTVNIPGSLFRVLRGEFHQHHGDDQSESAALLQPVPARRLYAAGDPAEPDSGCVLAVL